mmetsp:Transcript_16886/g.40109  ORF Transcript_16886/g.40109 Transcript_16886/m.40109 type:complete len:147 (-) Transcript_16886:199-639(-)
MSSSASSCRQTSRLYTPSAASKSAWLPLSTMVPSAMTNTESASRTVERRWAMTREERPRMSSASALRTTCSLSASRALVASSSKRMRGSRTAARATATRCFCPPLSRTPRSPTSVAMPSVKSCVNAWTCASDAAASTASSVASAKP